MKNAQFALIEVFNDSSLHFKGNTAAVIWTETPQNVEEMQQMAADLNQPATTFLWPHKEKNGYNVRWFAPDGEIGLCGHGSLAASAFLGQERNCKELVQLVYNTGTLWANYQEEGCTIHLKGIPVVEEQAIPGLLVEGLGIPLKGYFVTDNKHIVLAHNERDVKNMQPDFSVLKKLKAFGYAVTAVGDNADFVSRTLVPHVMQLEDPATGSSHAALVPFWAIKLGKSKMVAHQLSARGGKFICENHPEGEVSLQGGFKFIAKGNLY